MREAGPKLNRRQRAAVLAVSLLAHAALLAWLHPHLRPGQDAFLADQTLLDDLLIAVPIAAPESTSAEPVSGVTLVDEELLGQLLVASVGPADQSGFDRSHPLPAAAVDLPGNRAAGRGGGDEEGGVPSFTGRRDRDQLRSQIWNGEGRYQVAHRRDAETSSTPEALARAPETGWGARQSHVRRARAGAIEAQSGRPGADGTGGQVDEVERIWRDADPRLDTGPATHQLERQIGSTQPGQERPLIDRGARAVETERLGPTARDDTSAVAVSNERDPMPLELTSASAGGRASGVEGAADAKGALPRAPSSARGTAAARAGLAVGDGLPAFRAHRQDPYFRRMYQRLDSMVEYPRERALALDQGEVVVAFTLFANGSIGDVRVLKSSGFTEFDHELTRAIRACAPFGPVPASLRGASDRIGVTAPYKFASPLIR